VISKFDNRKILPIMLTEEVKKYMEQSVLCWLATASADNIPNVSPKEVFTYFGDSHIIIANIASPQTIKNIEENKNICLSFINVFVQKGYQIKGEARIVDKADYDFSELETPLLLITKGNFPFASITSILVKQVKPIIAPSYFLFPNITETDQIESAKNTYGLI